MTWDNPARSDKASSDTRPALTDITPSPDKTPEASDIRAMVCGITASADIVVSLLKLDGNKSRVGGSTSGSRFAVLLEANV